MKKLLITGLVAAVLTTGMANAGHDERLVGALLGAATGLVIAHNVHGVNPWVAAPLGGLLGSYIADRHGRGGYGYRGYRHQPYYWGGYDCSYGYGYGYGYVPRETVVIRERERVVEQPQPVAAIADPHPGVDLIKISILNSNGIRTDVPVLRVNGKFVGPQGEEYETLPTGEMLAKRYGM